MQQKKKMAMKTRNESESMRGTVVIGRAGRVLWGVSSKDIETKVVPEGRAREKIMEGVLGEELNSGQVRRRGGKGKHTG